MWTKYILKLYQDYCSLFFYQFWIAKSQRIVASLASFIGFYNNNGIFFLSNLVYIKAHVFKSNNLQWKTTRGENSVSINNNAMCWSSKKISCYLMFCEIYRIYIFLALEQSNLKTQNKSILEILDQNRINIKVTFLYFSTNQLKDKIRI